jgi:hypothetical protein
MTKSVKALLLSALAFPGAGHYYLKKPLLGTLLAGISLLCIYLLFTTSLEIAEDLSKKIQAGEIPLDVNRLEQELTKGPAGKSSLIDISTYVLEACWLIGVADSFRVGRAKDKADAERGQT